MKNKTKNGYTLIELLAVIIILVAVGSIVTSILTSVLRASNKSTTLEEVRSNGNNAIAQMSKMITYAQKLDGVSCDGTTYYSDCVSQPALGCTSASGLTQYHYLQIKSFDGGTTTFACSDSKIASQSSAIAPGGDPCPIGSNCSSLVDPSLTAACYFNCSQESAAAPAKIDIFLDLKARSNTIFSESQAELPFETSVVIRNSGDR
jgi:type II secretory pathway pseudopilin PulG